MHTLAHARVIAICHRLSIAYTQERLVYTKSFKRLSRARFSTASRTLHILLQSFSPRGCARARATRQTRQAARCVCVYIYAYIHIHTRRGHWKLMGHTWENISFLFSQRGQGQGQTDIILCGRERERGYILYVHLGLDYYYYHYIYYVFMQTRGGIER